MSKTVAQAAADYRARRDAKLKRLTDFAILAKAELADATGGKGKRLHDAACEALGERIVVALVGEQ